jgi:hypothetical protein
MPFSSDFFKLNLFKKKHSKTKRKMASTTTTADQKVLTPNQQTLVEEIVAKLQNYPICINTSQTGSGKTITTIHAAKNMDCSLFVLCPTGVIDSWKKECESEGVSIEFISSYTSFIQYSNPYMHKKESDVVSPTPSTNPAAAFKFKKTLSKTFTYQPTIKLQNLVSRCKKIPESTNASASKDTESKDTESKDTESKDIESTDASASKDIESTDASASTDASTSHKKIMFVFDEFHALKTETSHINNVVSKMNYWLLRAASDSTFFLFLSSTPYDKYNNAFALYRAFGMTKAKSVNVFAKNKHYNNTNENTIKEIENVLRRICLKFGQIRDENEIEKRLNEIRSMCLKSTAIVGTAKFHLHIHILLNELFFPLLTVAMPSQVYDTTYRNVVLKVNPIITRKISLILNNIRDISEGMSLRRGGGGFGDIIIGMHALERYRAIFTVPYAHNILLSNENRKLCIFVNFLDVLQFLQTALSQYNPLVLYGKQTKEARTEIISTFNQPNNNHRVIIVIAAVGGVGINLHDTDGRFPRHSIIFPDYNLKIQCCGRTNRIGTLSPTNIDILFFSTLEDNKYDNDNDDEDDDIEDTIVESRVYEAIALKKDILGEVIDSKLKDLPVLSSKYPVYNVTIINNDNTISEEEELARIEQSYNQIETIHVETQKKKNRNK